jgi:NAD(P)-dependent dehydrogenase (short-subunit alcohol dehydrogenase family)
MTAMAPESPHRTVLLIGASRGLGLAMTEEYLNHGSRVVATVRSEQSTELHHLQGQATGRLDIEHLDITIPEQVMVLHRRLAATTFDLLFVNAGVTNDAEDTITDISTEEFTRLMVTNALSPMRVVEALQDLVGPNGTIGVMSSGQGSIANNEGGGIDVYRASKAALNMFMRSYAARHHNDWRTLLLMAPGWVNTRLGGPNARLTIDESIPKLVQVIDAQHGHGGLQYLDYRGETVPW